MELNFLWRPLLLCCFICRVFVPMVGSYWHEMLIRYWPLYVYCTHAVDYSQPWRHVFLWVQVWDRQHYHGVYWHVHFCGQQSTVNFNPLSPLKTAQSCGCMNDYVNGISGVLVIRGIVECRSVVALGSDADSAWPSLAAPLLQVIYTLTRNVGLTRTEAVNLATFIDRKVGMVDS